MPLSAPDEEFARTGGTDEQTIEELTQDLNDKSAPEVEEKTMFYTDVNLWKRMMADPQTSKEWEGMVENRLARAVQQSPKAYEEKGFKNRMRELGDAQLDIAAMREEMIKYPPTHILTPQEMEHYYPVTELDFENDPSLRKLYPKSSGGLA